MQAAGDTNAEVLFLREHAQAATPRVTVIVPLFNYDRFVTETLDSVAAQTLAELDVIVVDDCSTDDSAAVACRWMEQHFARFRRAMVLKHRVNGGLAATRNTGFGRSETEFVFPLDADNLLYPTCLAKLSRSLGDSHAAFAYCILERFLTPDGEVPPPYLMNIHPWRADALALGNKIDAMVLLRASTWKDAGGYSLNMPCQGWEDYDLWFKIARNGSYGLQVLQILGRYRVHAGSMLHTVTNTDENVGLLKTFLRTNYPEFYNQAVTVGRKRRLR
jgi:GT2 family glycosyltransferase